MSMTMETTVPVEVNWEERCALLTERNASLQEDLRIANSKLKGDEVTTGAVREQKIARQRAHLSTIERRIRVQRLQLRRLNELNRGLTDEERNQLEADYSSEIGDDVWAEVAEWTNA